MLAIVVNASRSVVCESVCGTPVSPANSAEPIKMQLRGRLVWAPARNRVLERGAHRRHLANTIERSTRASMRLYVKLLLPLVIVSTQI